MLCAVEIWGSRELNQTKKNYPEKSARSYWHMEEGGVIACGEGRGQSRPLRGSGFGSGISRDELGPGQRRARGGPGRGRRQALIFTTCRSVGIASEPISLLPHLPLLLLNLKHHQHRGHLCLLFFFFTIYL